MDSSYKMKVTNMKTIVGYDRAALDRARCGRVDRRGFIARAAVLGLASAGAGALSLWAAAGQKIRLATLAPKDTSFHQSLKTMAQKWQNAPGGGVELTIYTDGTMGGETDMVRRMRVGQLQAAMLTVAGLSEIDPAVGGLQKLPLLYRTLEELVYVREKLRPIVEQRFTAKGFHLLGWADAGWVRFFSKEPATTPDEFKKLKMFVLSSDKDHIEIMQSEGYRAVPLEYTDTLTALQTGMIDTVPTTPTYALAGQFFGVASHMMEVNWAPLVGGIVITKKAWDALPAEAKPVLTQAATDAAAELQAKSRKESDEAVVAMQKRGLTVHKVTAETEKQWAELGDRIMPRVRGKMVPADIYDEVQRLLKEYRAAK